MDGNVLSILQKQGVSPIKAFKPGNEVNIVSATGRKETWLITKSFWDGITPMVSYIVIASDYDENGHTRFHHTRTIQLRHIVTICTSVPRKNMQAGKAYRLCTLQSDIPAYEQEIMQLADEFGIETVQRCSSLSHNSVAA